MLQIESNHTASWVTKYSGGWGLHVTENVDLWYGHPGSCSHSIHLSRLRPFSFHGEYLGVADQGLKSWIGEVIERSNNTHQLLILMGLKDVVQSLDLACPTS